MTLTLVLKTHYVLKLFFRKESERKWMKSIFYVFSRIFKRVKWKGKEVKWRSFNVFCINSLSSQMWDESEVK